MLAEFQMYPARALASSWTDVIEGPGCYIMVLLDHENDVNAALLAHAAEVPVFAAWPLLYVGATGDNLRTRLKSHLGLETRNSSLRQSAGLLLKDTLGLHIHPIPGKRYFCFKDETILTDDARKAEFTGAAREARQAMFSDGGVTKSACVRIVAATGEGAYDYRQHAEFFPTLQALEQARGRR